MTDERIRKAIAAIEDSCNEEAIAILEPLVKKYDPDPDALVYLGLAYIQAERPLDAVKVLKQAQEMVEDHCVLALFLGRALRSLGKYEESEDELRKAIELEPDDPEAWIELGKLLYSMGNFGEAARIMEEAIILFPEDLSLRGTLALALYKLGDFTQATNEWANLHRLDPDLMAAMTNYAYVLLLQNRVEEALPVVEEAFHRDSEDYRALVLKGMVSLTNGENENAKRYFEKILENYADNVEALSRLAVIEYENGDKHRGEVLLDIAEKQIDSEQECWRGLCFAYSRLGMYDKHIDCLLRWTRKESGAAAPWIALAIEYDRTGKRNLALKAWQQAMELRGYIRINCSNCKESVKYDLSKFTDFDPYESLPCSNCGSMIKMPAGLLAQ